MPAAFRRRKRAGYERWGKEAEGGGQGVRGATHLDGSNLTNFVCECYPPFIRVTHVQEVREHGPVQVQHLKQPQRLHDGQAHHHQHRDALGILGHAENVEVVVGANLGSGKGKEVPEGKGGSILISNMSDSAELRAGGAWEADAVALPIQSGRWPGHAAVCRRCSGWPDSAADAPWRGCRTHGGTGNVV